MLKKILFIILFLLPPVIASALNSFVLLTTAVDSLHSKTGNSYYIDSDITVYLEGRKYNYAPVKPVSDRVLPHEVNTAFTLFESLPADFVITINYSSEGYEAESEILFVTSSLSEAYDNELDTFSNESGKFSTVCSLYYDESGWSWYHCVLTYQYDKNNSETTEFEFTRLPYQKQDGFYDLVVITAELSYLQENQNTINAVKAGNIVNSGGFNEYIKENLILFGIIISVVTGILSALLTVLITLGIKNRNRGEGKKESKSDKVKETKVNYSRKKWTIQDLIDIDRKGGRYY